MHQNIFSCPAPPGPANGTYFSLFSHLKWTKRARLESDRKGRRNGQEEARAGNGERGETGEGKGRKLEIMCTPLNGFRRL